MYRHHPLLTALSIFVLVGSPQTLASSNTSTTGASLRVGDYTTGDQLSNGTALPLYTLVWRAVGNSFSSSSVATNQTFAKNANTAFLDAPHTMTYTIINIQNAAASNTTRKLNGDIGLSGSHSTEHYRLVLSVRPDQRCFTATYSGLPVQWTKSQIHQSLCTAALICS